MECCHTLQEYAEYVHRVRSYAKDMPIEAAVEKAIDECIAEGILREFLERNKAEAKTVCIYEYNEEEQLQYERECSFEEGRRAGVAEQQVITERERQRADNAEAENQRLRDELERLKSTQ